LALGKIADDSLEVQSAIRKQMTSESAMHRAAAIHALVRPGSDSPRLITEFVEILRSDSVGYVRAHAAQAIGALSGDRRRAIDPLTDALQDPDPEVRKMAAITLASIGLEARSALPALHQAWLEAKCGIPRTPFPRGHIGSPALWKEDHELTQLPLTFALQMALTKLERTQ